jgi:glycosyltransferase involved in cell wall biosynthesis
MKILYVACSYSPLNYNDGSSADYELYHAFLDHGATVKIVGPLKDHPGWIELSYRKMHALFSKRRHAKYSLAFLEENRHAIAGAVNEFKPDVIFSYFSAPLARVKTEVPIVYAIDTSLIASQSNWPLFSFLEYHRMLNWERNVVRRSAAVITWSQWSAEILAENYSVPERRIFYFPIPASLPSGSLPEHLAVGSEDLLPLKLLLVGRDYQRKGVDIAIRLVKMLNDRGIETHLRIVGLNGTDTDNVRFFGNYNKADAGQLEEYINHYRWAHFLLHPARFEAAGIVPSEAAAFGVPTITNAVGGLATTVEDHRSGIVLPRHSPAESYLEVLQYYLDRPLEYQELRRSTRLRYEEELNWSATGGKIFALMEKVSSASSHPVL